MSIFRVNPPRDIMEKKVLIICTGCHREFPHPYTTPEKYNNLIAEWECLFCGGKKFEVSVVRYSAPKNTMLERYPTK